MSQLIKLRAALISSGIAISSCSGITVIPAMGPLGLHNALNDLGGARAASTRICGNGTSPVVDRQKGGESMRSCGCG